MRTLRIEWRPYDRKEHRSGCATKAEREGAACCATTRQSAEVRCLLRGVTTKGKAAPKLRGRPALLEDFFLVDCEVDGRRAIGRCRRRGNRKCGVANERDVQGSALRRHRVRITEVVCAYRMRPGRQPRLVDRSGTVDDAGR